ncbi:hypothetical protein acsn021_09650 [Anaerocolumna cellulosilytica]|uniref:O-antigen ligase-related domain-containing protein n=1 Tax=Anaerocolumna cellulosilytica TaxID=433286 RepID=A0A6S6QUM9_9FIRM|nr:O-antigen ligase family protein [Anaerocolumna cellulosilytica]MBB5194451.1 O-antigen ligase [Anaerocolumna cellulosilytica]BCJ93396.1 hypothetical protein acsn021_09650 [Anaerocolumna cellulosilytica]
MTNIITKIFNKLLYLCTILFIFEMFIGFNGKMLILLGTPIRYILFGIVFSGLLVKTIINLVTEITYITTKESHPCYKEKVRINKISIFIDLVKNYFTFFDFILALFLLLNIIYVFVVPFFSGTSIIQSLKETKAVLLVLCYFPIVILIKLNKFPWEKYRKAIKVNVILLALVHIIFYVGEVIAGDATFVLNLFLKWEEITYGYSQRPLVMMPKDGIRIIYSTGILLVLIFYFTIDSLKIKDIAILIPLGICAIFTTNTKSLIFGIVGGMVVIGGMLIFKHIKFKQASLFRNFIILITVTAVYAFIIDTTMFNNYVFSRISVTFATATQNEDFSDNTMFEVSRDSQILVGTKKSNETRLIQIKQLLNTWKERPLFGWGYGSSAINYLRSSEEVPYIYEMTGVALLMKIGITGIMLWLSYCLYLLWYILRNVLRNERVIAVTFIAVALGISTQFNPYLFGMPGMALLLFCFIEIKSGNLLE